MTDHADTIRSTVEHWRTVDWLRANTTRQREAQAVLDALDALLAERQQAIDALRETQEKVRLALVEASRNTTDGNDTRADGYAAGLHKALYLFPDAAALLNLGEQEQP